MKATRQRDTGAELALRSALNHHSLKYSIDVRPIPQVRRRADIVFEHDRVAVFVDGCFWHGCPIHGTWPRENAEFWRDKIETNRHRDADTDRRLQEAGWIVIRIWEHEDVRTAADRIEGVLRTRRSQADLRDDAN